MPILGGERESRKEGRIGGEREKEKKSKRGVCIGDKWGSKAGSLYPCNLALILAKDILAILLS